MYNLLLKKEMKLTAMLITYLFIVFGVMVMIPGYPILVGFFFGCLGIFQTFQNGNECNDIFYTALLPVKKSDVVKAKYVFVVFIELMTALLAAVCTLVRMLFLSNYDAYVINPMQNANLFMLGYMFVIYGLFNLIFLGGFFKTAYQIGKPFVITIIAVFLWIGVTEALHHFPGLEILNTTGFESIGLQIGVFVAGIVICVVMTLLSYKKSVRNFEMIDL